MKQPLHAPAIPAPQLTPRRAGIATTVALLHVGLFFVLITGLTSRAIDATPSILEAEVLPKQDKARALPPPSKPELAKPQLPTIPVPTIRIAREIPTRSISVVRGPTQVSPPVERQITVPAPAPARVPAPTQASAVAGTHTIPPYPPMARRLGEEGVVTLQIALDARGAVTQVAIKQSSGHARLDTAAAHWVQYQWRYHPATRSDKPVSATVYAQIQFNLRQVR